jgi:hypothetical protein
MTLEHVVFADDATHLQLSGVWPSDERLPEAGTSHRHVSRGGPTGRDLAWPPRVLTVRDDNDTETLAVRRQGGGDDRSWRGRFTTQLPLSPTTAWIEIAGVRLGCPTMAKGRRQSPRRSTRSSRYGRC